MAADRLNAMFHTLNEPARDKLPELLSTIRDAVTKDPQLPRSNPSISLWQEPPNQRVAAIQSTNIPEKTDFVVIGSGITGCSVTKSLLEHPTLQAQGSHITVLEARTLVSGATGRNGGHLVSAAGHTYSDLARRYGEENAKQITRFSIRNIDYILKMVRNMDEDLQNYSQIRDVIKVMVAGDKETWEHARASLVNFKDAVPEHHDYHRIVEEEDVADRWNVKNAFGAIEHEAGALWPYRLLTGLYERLLTEHSHRLAIEANTPVTSIDYIQTSSSSSTPGSDYPYVITTPRGTIRAAKVIHCTNAFASHLLPNLRGKVYPFRGTMSVQKAGSHLENVGASRSWSSMNQTSLDAQSFLYKTGLIYLQQNAETGDIWVGTESSKIQDILTADDTYVTEEARQTLRSFLPTYFQQGWGDDTTVTEFKGIWSGVQGHTADGLPLVGRVFDDLAGRACGDGEWIAAGFNGYGMDKCWLTGEALVKMIMGEDVSFWFPQCYLINEKRFQEDLKTQRILDKFTSIARTGSW